MRIRHWMSLTLPLLCLLAACTTANKELDAKVENETAVHSRAGLQAKSANMIENAKGLSAGQRNQLLSLRESSRRELDQLSSESIKLRSVLMGDVLSPNYNAAEVQTIKKRLSKVENKKLAVIFSAVDRANAIFGRDAIENREAIMRELIESQQKPQF